MTRSSKSRAVVALLAAAVLLVACGSDGHDRAEAPTATKAAPIAAKENAAAEPVCHDLYNGGQLACAENTVGPGGGVIFYDAKTVQPWGRFLEVAPQNWNGSLYDCPGSKWGQSSCGAASNIAKKTSDLYEAGGAQYGWKACGHGGTAIDANNYLKMPGAAANLPAGIGSGRANTAAVLAVADCTAPNPDNSESGWSAFQKAANYRGGGLADWFIPSADELVALCRFGNRNAIGGFSEKWHYLGSTTATTDATRWTRIAFDAGCTPDAVPFGTDPGSSNAQSESLTRPVRAF